MAPKEIGSEKANVLANTKESLQEERGIHEVQSSHGTGPSSTFTHCNSIGPYEAYQDPYSSPVKVNKSLNLHLGMPFNPRKIKSLRRVCKLLSDLLAFVETHLFRVFEAIPLRLRQIVLIKVWALYLPLHRATLTDSTGIHRDASVEYHALTTIMYWTRLFPVTVRRIRYSLSMLPVYQGPGVYPTTRIKQSEIKVDKIYYVTNKDEAPLMKVLSQRESDRPVSGYYVHNDNGDESSSSSNKSKKVIFYLYGGAFLGGDAKGNVPFGSKLSQKCSMDVFLPQYRLLPEYHFFDALDDIIRAYAYLIEVKNINPENVILFGISSGGGLIVRLLQRIVELQSKKESLKCGGMLNIPNGAVLMSPFVDYTTPKGSFQEYTVHDLIVNEVSCMHFVVALSCPILFFQFHKLLTQSVLALDMYSLSLKREHLILPLLAIILYVSKNRQSTDR